MLLAAVAETVEQSKEPLEQSKDAVLNSLTALWKNIESFGPKIVVMLVILVMGYIISRLVARAITLLSERVGFQVAAERSGLAKSMQHMGINRNVPAIIGSIVFWLLMLVAVMAAFNFLGLDKLTSATSELVNYIPKLLIATVVVVVGLLVASLMRGVVATSADRVGLTYAEHLANACYYVLAILTFMAAFRQLNLEFELLNNLILIACGGLALGFGLSFGLGGRDVMAGILAGYYLRQRLHSGDLVEIGDLEGVVREVGPVATIVETEEGGLVNRRSIPNTKMLNEAVR